MKCQVVSEIGDEEEYVKAGILSKYNFLEDGEKKRKKRLRNQSECPRVHSSSSITSSVLDYEYENGRRYHGYRAGSYPLPHEEVRKPLPPSFFLSLTPTPI